ncbi:hypothetical protein BFU36_04440 [Sulfolobus sp. A20]|uniref:hypothetical protein n=1 Tax=Saccharolobus sp. A20 TaxID=1891280 RepID=UPI000863B41A|nr:hypothetical protein [Sulfolobus sp. A20]AOL16095.1 hypothetical protein BFU36_04440 [Sulfolobus sp. A20]
MIFDIFKRDKDSEVKDPFYTDEFGEWIIISHNKLLLFVYNLLVKSIKKIGLKNFELYIIQYSEDEKIKNLINVKGMIVTNGNFKELELANAIKNNVDNHGFIGEIKIFKFRLCGSLFIFFYIDLIVKNITEAKGHVKVLFPPYGVNLYSVPYTFQSLLKDVIEKNLGLNCNLRDIEVGDGTRLKLLAECKVNQGLESVEPLKKALEYFSLSEPKISTNRVSAKQIELQIFVNQLKTKALIPLIWDHFIIDSLRC